MTLKSITVKTILLLEDNEERVAAFASVVRELGEEWGVRVWRDAPTMVRECEGCFEGVHFVSLDHDLNRQPGAKGDPGSGLQVAKLFASHFPFCPIIIHSSNTDAAWSMHNELRFAAWTVDFSKRHLNTRLKAKYAMAFCEHRNCR